MPLFTPPLALASFRESLAARLGTSAASTLQLFPPRLQLLRELGLLLRRMELHEAAVLHEERVQSAAARGLRVRADPSNSTSSTAAAASRSRAGSDATATASASSSSSSDSSFSSSSSAPQPASPSSSSSALPAAAASAVMDAGEFKRSSDQSSGLSLFAGTATQHDSLEYLVTLLSALHYHLVAQAAVEAVADADAASDQQLEQQMQQQKQLDKEQQQRQQQKGAGGSPTTSPKPSSSTKPPLLRVVMPPNLRPQSLLSNITVASRVPLLLVLPDFLRVAASHLTPSSRSSSPSSSFSSSALPAAAGGTVAHPDLAKLPFLSSAVSLLSRQCWQAHLDRRGRTVFTERYFGVKYSIALAPPIAFAGPAAATAAGKEHRRGGAGAARHAGKAAAGPLIGAGTASASTSTASLVQGLPDVIITCSTFQFINVPMVKSSGSLTGASNNATYNNASVTAASAAVTAAAPTVAAAGAASGEAPLGMSGSGAASASAATALANELLLHAGPLLEALISETGIRAAAPAAATAAVAETAPAAAVGDCTSASPAPAASGAAPAQVEDTSCVATAASVPDAETAAAVSDSAEAKSDGDAAGAAIATAAGGSSAASAAAGKLAASEPIDDVVISIDFAAPAAAQAPGAAEEKGDVVQGEGDESKEEPAPALTVAVTVGGWDLAVPFPPEPAPVPETPARSAFSWWPWGRSSAPAAPASTAPAPAAAAATSPALAAATAITVIPGTSSSSGSGTAESKSTSAPADGPAASALAAPPAPQQQQQQQQQEQQQASSLCRLDTGLAAAFPTLPLALPLASAFPLLASVLSVASDLELLIARFDDIGRPSSSAASSSAASSSSSDAATPAQAVAAQASTASSLLPPAPARRAVVQVPFASGVALSPEVLLLRIDRTPKAHKAASAPSFFSSLVDWLMGADKAHKLDWPVAFPFEAALFADTSRHFEAREAPSPAPAAAGEESKAAEPAPLASPALTLPPLPARDPYSYSLCAAACHAGVQMDSGHFTALVRGPRGDSFWYRADDAKVAPLLVTTSWIASPEVYTLVYVRGKQ